MSALDPYDAVLLVSFGGPEGPEQVMPFLRSVTSGRNIPPERLAEVGQHYIERDGRSPINDETRALAAALGAELIRRGHRVPVLIGNRHLEPSLSGALAQAAQQGARRVVAVLTSAYPSYSSCRQYREDLARALGALPPGAHPVVDKLAPYALQPAFADTMAQLTAQGVQQLVCRRRIPLERVALVFVTHSLPVALDESSGPVAGGGQAYSRWHAELCERIVDHVQHTTGVRLRHDLVFCSRSGPPNQPWLEPDVNDHLEVVAHEGFEGVVVVPLGFVSDHMEVVYDLDTMAAQCAAQLGLAFHRVPTVRTHPRFVAGLVELLVERARRAGGQLPVEPQQGRWPDDCSADCCPNPRGSQPAVCGNEPAVNAEMSAGRSCP